MNILKNKGILTIQLSGVVVLICAVIFFNHCSTDPVDDPIPFQPFPEIIINVNLPENLILRNTGGFKAVNGGVRGIILYRMNTNQYHAFERNCTFRPNEACATVDVHISGLYMNDSCCNSTFDFNGIPTGGPAWRPLRQYRTTFDGNEIRITDEIL
jgi:hypothetical protein